MKISSRADDAERMTSWASAAEEESTSARSRAAPRWHIDTGALEMLENIFNVERFPNVETRKKLGAELHVSPRQIQVWFQNRRQRERKQKERGKQPGQDGAELSDDGDQGMASDAATVCLSSGNLSGNLSSGDLSKTDEQLAEARPSLSPEVARRGIPLAPVPVDPSNLVTMVAPTDRTTAAAVPKSSLPAGLTSCSGETEAVVSSSVLSQSDSIAPRNAPPSPASTDLVPTTSRKRELDGVVPNEAPARGAGVKASAHKRAASGATGPGAAAPEPAYDWHAAMRTLLPRLASTMPQSDVGGGFGGISGTLNGIDPMLRPSPVWSGACKHEQELKSSAALVSASGVESGVASRMAAACQSALLGKTLQEFGGIVQEPRCPPQPPPRLPTPTSSIQHNTARPDPPR